MGRIRSIYPTTPYDPEFASIPRDGRLLFIYSWTIADDAGNLERSPKGLKMACFPADDDLTAEVINELTKLLIAGRFYIPYEAEGKQFLHIRNFAKYQKPDHPTRPKFPLRPNQEYIFHRREGNAFVPVALKGPSINASPPVTRALPEHTGNVPTGEELEMGLELDRETELDRKRTGGERKGGERGGKENPTSSPSWLEDPEPEPSTTASQQSPTDNGKGVREEKASPGLSQFLESLPQKMEDALKLTFVDFQRGRMDLKTVTASLRAAGFTGSDLSRALRLFKV